MPMLRLELTTMLISLLLMERHLEQQLVIRLMLQLKLMPQFRLIQQLIISLLGQLFVLEQRLQPQLELVGLNH